MEPKRRRRPGWLLVGILFVVGGLFLGGLFMTARWGVPAEYRTSKVGVPAQSIRVASLDLGWKLVDGGAVAESLKAARADFVLLQGVSRKDAQVIGNALGMRHGGRQGGQLQMVYSPGNSEDAGRPGNAILGRHGLFKGRVMQRKKTDSAGVVAEAVVAGRRFMLGSVDFGSVKGVHEVQAEFEGLTETWRAAGEGPVVVGGDWAGAVGGVGVPMEPWVGVQQLGFVLSKEWGLSKSETLGGGGRVVRVVEIKAKD